MSRFWLQEKDPATDRHVSWHGPYPSVGAASAAVLALDLRCAECVPDSQTIGILCACGDLVLLHRTRMCLCGWVTNLPPGWKGKAEETGPQLALEMEDE